MIPKQKSNPVIPKPKPKEQPDTELLVTQPHARLDTRPEVHKEPQRIKVPLFNRLYDSLGSEQAWRYTCDDQASGTVTTVANTTVLVAVSLSTPASMSPKFKIDQWPGAPQVYLVLRTFAIGPQTASFATQGEIATIFIDQFGNQLPLGIFPNNNFSTFTETSILPTPITDPANLSVGNLSFTLNTGATVGTYAWQIGFSYAYLMPAKRGYTWEILHGFHLF